ncbi:MAG: EamA family transporter [Alphaproteobacteria bacterium]|nr:EamA family transporter [Alphaproteobacteria bacterium]
MIDARTLLLTTLAMVAFAANSLLCRLALAPGSIDPASFMTLRILSGAFVLGLIVLSRRRRSCTGGGWRSALMLFGYVAFFSFAYRSLGAGTGALILFGAVQLTMFAAALRAGERFAPPGWLGLGLAVAGLVYLVLPGVKAPDLAGAGMMALAGVAWGLYSLSGRGAADPLGATARNFLYAAPLVAIVSLVFLKDFHVSPWGAALAVMSGAVTSGCGYVVWYAALPRLSATQAAIVQLTVPAIASFGGVVFLSENLTLRLVLASAATLGGVAIVLLQRAGKRAKA